MEYCFFFCNNPVTNFDIEHFKSPIIFNQIHIANDNKTEISLFGELKIKFGSFVKIGFSRYFIKLA